MHCSNSTSERRMRTVNRRVIVLVIVLASLPPVLGGDVKLPALISDGMVLQQGAKVNLWGTADPAETVAVDFNGSQANAAADQHGYWHVKIGPLSAGGPFTLKIRGKNTIVIHDVLVG